MNLRDTTRDLIGQAEQQTGYMVEVGPNRALANMSTVIVVGRHTLPKHVICYNPYFENILDCLVGFQYGMFLRLFASLLQEKAREIGGRHCIPRPAMVGLSGMVHE